MSLSFEDALRTLQSMFSSWDPDTLATMLEANGGHMERTIDVLLALDSGEELSTGSGNGTTEITRSSHIPSRGPISKKCILPDDFLRVPKSQAESEQLKTDEILAMMLQDEMFRNELFRNEEFAEVLDSSRSSRSAHPHSTPGSREKTTTEYAQDALNSVSGKISSMSQAMKDKMHDMYRRFQMKKDASSGNYSHVPLMAKEDEDEDESKDEENTIGIGKPVTSGAQMRQRHVRSETEMRNFSTRSPSSANKRNA